MTTSKVRDISYMTWREVHEALTSGYRTIVFGVGSTEQHGPHMPLCVDTILGAALSERVAEHLPKSLTAPPIHVGQSSIHMDFAGSLTLEAQTVQDVVAAYCRSLARHGFEWIIVLPTHGGNFAPSEKAVAMLRQELAPVRVSTFTDFAGMRDMLAAIMERDGLPTSLPGLHAGEMETSLMLYLRPDLVRRHLVESGFTGPSTNKRPYSSSIREVSDNGVLGDPRPASAKRGEEYFRAWVDLVLKTVLKDDPKAQSG
jgi:creatinine amidohydrolase